MDGRRLTQLPVFVTTLIASLAIATPAASAADCAGGMALRALSSIPTAKAATLCLLNAEREARGLAPLSVDPVLETAAMTYSQAMVQQRFFQHVSPAGQTIEERLASYVASAAGSWSIGENLAWGEGPLATPASIVRGWMASSGHRDNILNGAFAEIGVGIAGGSPVGSAPAISATYTTEFGAAGDGGASRAGSGSRASASSLEPLPVRTVKRKRVSAKQKAKISKRCHRVAKRTKASKKTRKARYDRCMSKALRAAAR
jgi:uncharacterized protein YkwD